MTCLKNYDDIAKYFYPDMPDKSQIQESKRIPLLTGNNEPQVKYYDDFPTLADRNYVAKPIDESFTGGAAKIFNKSNNTQINEIAGVKKGKPMTFEQAGGKNVNPNYNPMIRNSYSKNCQSAIAVFEARMRGYDIEVSIENQDTIEKLKERPNLAYIDSKTGKTPEFQKINVSNIQECENLLNNIIKKGERYVFAFKRKSVSYGDDSAHILITMKNDKGELIFYDPQTSKEYKSEYLNLIKFSFNKREEKVTPKLLRVDDKELNYDILNKISKPSKNSR